MISVAIVIRDTEQEAESYVDSLPYNKGVTVFGTEDSVLKKLIKIKSDNPSITDYMLQGHAEDFNNWDRIHSMSKKLMGNYNAGI